MKVEFLLRMPEIPEYLLLEKETGIRVHITELTEKQLQEIGEKWTKALIQRKKHLSNIHTHFEGGGYL